MLVTWIAVAKIVKGVTLVILGVMQLLSNSSN